MSAPQALLDRDPVEHTPRSAGRRPRSTAASARAPRGPARGAARPLAIGLRADCTLFPWTGCYPARQRLRSSGSGLSLPAKGVSCEGHRPSTKGGDQSCPPQLLISASTSCARRSRETTPRASSAPPAAPAAAGSSIVLQDLFPFACGHRGSGWKAVACPAARTPRWGLAVLVRCKTTVRFRPPTRRVVVAGRSVQRDG